MITDEALSLITDPFKFQQLCWPQLSFYDKQVEIIKSVIENDETYVPAGNKLGKDWVAGFICVWFFVSRHPCRIVTTSAKDDHLDVLWGEIRNFINTSVIPLDYQDGGTLVCNQKEIRKVLSSGRECAISYVKGMVASPDKIAAMQGHHVAAIGDNVPRTMFISDESSSVPHDYYSKARTWFNRALIFGNTWACENFFKHAVKGEPGGRVRGGDLPRKHGKGLYRKVIRIKAEDSPNVRLGLEEKRRGLPISFRIIIPGVKPYDEYLKDRELMNEAEQCVCLDADWYEGSDVLMFPPEWLNRAEQLADERAFTKRRARAMGVDTGEGTEDTDWYIVDHLGILHRKAMKTTDTADIPGITIDLMREWKFLDHPEDVVFDRGGGGKEHADILRRLGYEVTTIGFGEAATETDLTKFKDREQVTDSMETRYAYFNRRAEMYGTLRNLLNPRYIEVAGSRQATAPGFGIPRQFHELRRQLAPLPLKYDSEGRLYLIPKDVPRRTTDKSRYTGLTIKQLIGCSPNEADALALAVFRMLNKPSVRVIGAVPLMDPNAIGIRRM